MVDYSIYLKRDVCMKKALNLSVFKIILTLVFSLQVHAAVEISDTELESIQRWKDKFFDLQFQAMGTDGKQNGTSTNEPLIASCSLKSTRFQDILAKTEELVASLKDQCTDKNDQNKVADVANIINKLQDELKTKGLVDKDSEGLIPTEIDGIKVNLLFQNINSLVSRGQCRKDDFRVLNVAADVVQDISALGVLSPTPQGLLVSGGGAVVATALRLIDTLLKEKFDFDKVKDRSAYIKLNCSYYELRKQLYVSGFFEMDKNTIKRDAETIKNLNNKLTNELNNLKAKEVTLKGDEGLAVSDKAEIKKLSSMRETFQKLKESLLIKESDGLLPKETLRLRWIGVLASEQVNLEAAVNQYMQLENRPLPFMDTYLQAQILTFSALNINDLQKYFNMSYDQFSDGPRAQLIYHSERIVDDLTKREATIKKKGNPEPSKVKLAEVQAEIKIIEKQLVDLKVLIDRLKSFENQKMFDRFDDGSENSITILDNMNSLNRQVFGEYGFKFIDFAMKRSSDELDRWIEKRDRLEKRHVQIIREIEAESFDNDTSNIERNYFCQDIQGMRHSWAYITSVADLGYDFLAANRDLFNTDTFNTYGMRNDEENTLFTTQIEKIQRHYVSAVYAKKVSRGLKLDDEKAEKYLSNKYYGSIMLKVTEASKNVNRYDRLFEKAQCSKIFQMNL